MPSLTVNGRGYTILPEHQSLTLLAWLREVRDLTGTKCGCGAGACGTCKVILDGTAVNACLHKMNKLDGSQITTIEGVGAPGALDPIQRAFIESGAIQCGFCTPGMVITAKVLLDANPAPGEAEIRRAFRGNLCRCTGYVKIVKAVQLAARLRGGEVAGNV